MHSEYAWLRKHTVEEHGAAIEGIYSAYTKDTEAAYEQFMKDGDIDKYAAAIEPHQLQLAHFLAQIRPLLH